MPDEAEAAEVFGLLADPTRISILRAFAEALDEVELGTDGSLPTLSFSEVYDRVDVESTSHLSYHLEKLDGTYLRHTDEGWMFTFAGEAIVRLFLSGSYTERIEFDPIDVEGRCPFCEDEALRMIVDDLVLIRECTHCGGRMGNVPVTPAQVRDRGEESLLSSTKTRIVSNFWRFREGVCTECGGVVDLEFHDLSEDAPYDLITSGRCRQCWRSLNGPPSVWLSNHPASIAFHWDHGVDVLSFGLREMTALLANGDWRSERIASDEYEITYQVDGAQLGLRIDDDLSVSSIERVRRDSMA